MRVWRYTLLGLIVTVAVAVAVALTAAAGTQAPALPAEIGHASPKTASSDTVTQQAENVELIGQTGGGTYTAAVHNTYAYIGVGLRLMALDVSSPANPVVVGHTAPLPETVQDVYVVNGPPGPGGVYAYVAAREAGLRIIRATDPANPQEVGAYDTPGWSSDIYVVDNLVYVADGSGGLRIVDVSDPTAPQEVGAYDTPRLALGVHVEVGGPEGHTHAYVADGGGGLRVIDVSDPTDPQQVGAIDTPADAYGVFVAGGPQGHTYAYVAATSAGLRVVDVSDPTAPQDVGAYDTPGEPHEVHVVAGGPEGQTYAYVADYDAGLRVIDVSDPANPTEIGAFDTSGFVLDVDVATGGPQDRTYVYVADWNAGLRVVDVSNPSAPQEIGAYSNPGDAQGVHVSSNPSIGSGRRFAYLADGADGLRVIDVSDPASPLEVGTSDTPGTARRIRVAGTHAYIAAESAGLRILDVSDPANPQTIGAYDTPGDARGLDVDAPYAYVADGQSLRIVDISNPAAPTEIGTYDTPGIALGVHVIEDLAYVADDDSGFRILDVSDPANPREIGAHETPGIALGVYVAVGGPQEPTYAYIADYYGGLRVMDVSDPTAPQEIGSYNTPGNAVDVHVAAGGRQGHTYAYVADHDAGLRVVDVSDPAAPREVGAYPTSGTATGVDVDGGYIYVADWDGGLLVLRFTGGPTVTATPTHTSTPRDTATPTSTPTNTPPQTSTHTLTPSPTPTHTATDTETPTPTATQTPTASPTSTATNTPSPTPTPSPQPDDYEPDDTCVGAQTIVPEGVPQAHNAHVPGDADWLRFYATADSYYIVSALRVGSEAHPIIRLYNDCDEDPIADSGDVFGFDQIITFQAERTGLYYLRLNHRDPATAGDDTTYEVSVRPVTTGAAIIAGGRLYENDDLQPQITFMTERAYQTFQRAGYDDEKDIYYMSADPEPPPAMDAPSRPVTLRYAVRSWAPSHIQDGDSLFIYLTNHGENEFFFLDTGTHKVTPDDLDAWLLDFEAQRPNSPVILIIEACRSGSFIVPQGTISRPGRVIVTATGEHTDAYVKPPQQGGAYFSDAFFDALARNYDVWESYRKGRQAVREFVGNQQTPWVDGNGNGLPYPEDRDDEGAGRSLGLGRTAALAGGQPPYIEQPALPQPAEGAPGLIQVKVLDENPEGTTVWMAVTKPSTPPPSPPPGYITPISHAEREELTYNPTTGKFETDFAFDEVGTYQFMFHAEDAGGQRAQAVSAHVLRTDEAPLYLPLVAKQ